MFTVFKQRKKANKIGEWANSRMFVSTQVVFGKNNIVSDFNTRIISDWTYFWLQCLPTHKQSDDSSTKSRCLRRKQTRNGRCQCKTKSLRRYDVIKIKIFFFFCCFASAAQQTNSYKSTSWKAHISVERVDEPSDCQRSVDNYAIMRFK